MSSCIDKVIASLKFLELKPDIEKYEWRFLTQKITYLAQALGMQIYYNFTIYVAGPYSLRLAHDYYEQIDRVNSLKTNYKLTSEESEILEKIKTCNILKNPTLIECTSTIVYLVKSYPDIQDDEYFTKIKQLKPYLSEYDCLAGITKTKELLFKEEYLTEDLKREIETWDRIED